MNTPTSAVKRSRAAMLENMDSPNGSFSRLRRQSMIASTPRQPQPSTSTEIQINDDEAERRSLQRMSMIHNISERPRPIPSETMNEFLGNWLKMATENKINTKNVWKIHIIDYLKCLLDQEVDNPLILASSIISTSAKVYGLRVDDVYAKVLKLAGELGRRNPDERDENNSDQDDGGGDPVGNNNPEQPEPGPKKRAKRKNKKCVIVAPESLVGEPEQIYIDPALIAELNHRGGDILGVDNMLQLFMPIMDKTCEYQIRESEKAFDTDPPLALRNPNPNTDSEKMKCNFQFVPIEEVDDLKICEEFSKFSMVDQPADLDSSVMIPPGNPNLPATTDQINAAFDMEAEALPMLLDESLRQPMDNNNDFSSDEEVVAAEQVGEVQGNGANRPRIHTVENMRPGGVAGASQNLEYSWNTNYENDIWAGPAYWKLKSIQFKIKLRVPAETLSLPKSLARKKNTKQVTADLAYADPTTLNSRSSANKLKLTTLTTWNTNAKKWVLPVDLHIKVSDIMTLFFKPAIQILPPERPASNLSVGNMEYNYENLNDSAFCNPLTEAAINQDDHSVSDQDDIHGPDDFPIMENHTEDHADPTNMDEMFADGNLVAAPRVISKIFVPYAKRAKKVDMKRIKAAMWDNIVGGNEESRNCLDASSVSRNEETVDFDAIMFSEVCRKLPGSLSTDQASNLSPAIAYFALLHLAN